MTPIEPKLKGPARGQYIRTLKEAAASMTVQFFGIGWRRIVAHDQRSFEVNRARRWACWWLQSQRLSLREVARCVNRDHKAVERMVAKARDDDEAGRMPADHIRDIANRHIGDWATGRLGEGVSDDDR